MPLQTVTELGAGTPAVIPSGSWNIPTGFLRDIRGNDGTKVRVMIRVRAWDNYGNKWWQNRPTAVKRIR